MKKVFNDKYLIGLWVLTAIALAFFVGHYYDIIIDVGREVYYPAQILKGKVLYKDLFNIYGPFSYLFNAGIFKVFGAKLTSLYGAGIISSFLIVTGIYLIAKRFLSSFLSFSLGFLIIASGICSPLIFNFTFPYSWAMVYGLVCFLFSLYFLLKSEENNKFIYLSAFLAGISACNKYEFLLFGVFVLIFAFTKSIKTGFKSVAAFSAVPFVSFGILGAQGLKIPALIYTLKITSKMAKSQTIAYFYQNVGIFYHKKTLPFLLISFIKTAVPFTGMLYGAFVFDKKKWVLPFFAILSAIIASFSSNTVFFFVPLLLVILSLFSVKNFKENRALFILVISALCVSIKFFWGLLEGSYGTYVLGILLTAFFALFFRYVPQKYEKTAGIFILIYSVLITMSYSLFSAGLQFKQIVTQPILVRKDLAQSTTELLDYIQTKTKPTDRVVVLPEGLMINFLAKRPSDDWYNSLIPLYIEVFGEDKIIEHFKETQPEYIIFNNQTTKDYGFSYICKDYALEFCSFVNQNYTQAAVFSNGFNYLVYKLK